MEQKSVAEQEQERKDGEEFVTSKNLDLLFVRTTARELSKVRIE